MCRDPGGDERTVGTHAHLDGFDAIGIDCRVEEVLPGILRRQMRVLCNSMSAMSFLCGTR